MQYLKLAGAEGPIDILPGAAAHQDLSLSFIDSEPASPKKPESKTSSCKKKSSQKKKDSVKKEKQSSKASVHLTWQPPADSIPETVFVAGNFNQWSADSHPMTVTDKGHFSIDIAREALTTQVVEFKFVADGVWMACDQYEHCQDGMGGNNNCVRL